MTTPTTTTCNIAPVQTSLRIWLDPVAHSPGGYAALPPGVPTPPPQAHGPETHALNLELNLVNSSQNQQTVRVVGWSWSQGDRTHPATWNVQPDISPLNQYNQIQRQLVQLEGNHIVEAIMDLEINGQPCRLQAQTRP